MILMKELFFLLSRSLRCERSKILLIYYFLPPKTSLPQSVTTIAKRVERLYIFALLGVRKVTDAARVFIYIMLRKVYHGRPVS